jgi:uncharacterized protein YggE
MKKIHIAVVAIVFIAITIVAGSAFADNIPEKVSNYIKIISISQRNNRKMIPQRDELDALIKANQEDAAIAREQICKNYKDYCKNEYLNPMKDNVDLSRFLSFQ